MNECVVTYRSSHAIAAYPTTNDTTVATIVGPQP